MAESYAKIGIYETMAQTCVSFTSFMTAVVVFFTGLIITQFNTFDLSIKVPVAFLILSIFGFLYSTLIYTNVAEELAQRNMKRAKENFYLGDVLSEYIGVYSLVLSIPLVVNIITTDEFLRLVTLVASVGGFVIYQFSHFSMIERHFEKSYHVISIVIISLGVLLFFSQIYNYYFVEIAGLLLILLLGITYYAMKRQNIVIREK